MKDKKAKILHGCLLSILFVVLAGVAAFLFEYIKGDLTLSQHSRLYIFLILGIIIGIFAIITALFFMQNLEWGKRRIMIWAILAVTLVVNGLFGIFDLVGTSKDAIPLVVYSFSVTMGSLAFGFLFSKPWPSRRSFDRSADSPESGGGNKK